MDYAYYSLVVIICYKFRLLKLNSKYDKKRVTRFERAASTLARSRSTTELYPQTFFLNKHILPKNRKITSLKLLNYLAFIFGFFKGIDIIPKILNNIYIYIC
jgi:hypothetical protein